MAGRRRVSTRSVPDPAVVRIERIGADGDGVGWLPDGTTVYVQYVLPGELAEVASRQKRGNGWASTNVQLIEASTERVEPPCALFGQCGGCVLQHWSSAPYLRWKEGLLRSALEQAGFANPEVRPIRAVAPRTRRRVDLGLRRHGADVIVGLHQRGAGLVDLRSVACVVVRPELAVLTEPVRAMLRGLAALRRDGSVLITRLDDGLDPVLRTDGALGLSDRVRLASFARQTGLLRLCWAQGDEAPEQVCRMRDPVVRFGGVRVLPPPGGFLQASAEGEALIVEAVLAGLPAQMPAGAVVAELYAGCGTLTFPLARAARVHAWEGNVEAVAALRDGIRRFGLSGQVEAAQQDLARQPVDPATLRRFAAVVLDPPFAGAASQMVAIVQAKVKRVIYVSCNPAALKRDARVLRDAGYRLLVATPIDQFVWSARLEAVAVFEHDDRATRQCGRPIAPGRPVG